MNRFALIAIAFTYVLSSFAQQRELDKEKVAQTTFPYEYTVKGVTFLINENELQNETIHKSLMVPDVQKAEVLAADKKNSILSRIKSLEETKAQVKIAIDSKSIPNKIFLQVYGRYQEALVASGMDKKGLSAIYRAQESYVGEKNAPKDMLPFLDVYLADIDTEIEALDRILKTDDAAAVLSAADLKSSTITYQVMEGNGDRASYYQDRMFQKVRNITPYQLSSYEMPSTSEEYSFDNPFWCTVAVVPNEMDPAEWMWIHDKMNEVNTSYPQEDSYLVHNEHSEYQVRPVRLTGRQVYSGKKLVYMSLEQRTDQTYDFNSMNKLITAIVKKAYQDNKYNFKKESDDAQLVVRVRTGLYYDNSQKELMECILGKRYFIASDMSQYTEMSESEFREMCAPANSFEQQLNEDYRNQLASMRIKRLSNTSFLYYSTDGKLEIKEEWNDKGNSVCTVVKYKSQINILICV